MIQLSQLDEPSLADALRLIAADSSLSAGRKQAWATAIRSMAAAIGRPPESLPCRLTGLRAAIGKLNAAALGWQEKTLANHKSNLKAAVHHVMAQEHIPPRGAALVGDWARLQPRIEHVQSRRLLSALARFCSVRGIAPCDVTDETVRTFLAFRQQTSFRTSDGIYHRAVVKAWNHCAAHVPDWPQIRLASPERAPASAGPDWAAFPVGLQQDIDTYLASLSKPHRSANGKRRRGCKPSTLNTRKIELVAFARTAVASGIAISSLASLHAMLAPDVVTRTLETYLTRNGTRPKIYTVELPGKLLSIARVTGAPPETIDRLDEIRYQFEQERGPTLTEKNLKVIRSVMTTDIWQRVISLPPALMGRARRMLNSNPKKAATLATIALQIEILTRAPVRISNLLATRLDQNLTRMANGDYRLNFPGYDVKNRVELDFPLTASTAAMVEDFINNFRPHLKSSSTTDWLFPSHAGRHRSRNKTSKMIADLVERETGLRVTAHQFRHAAAALILKSDPGNYEFARRVLGHRNVSTTQRSYSGLESFAAAKAFNGILEQQIALDKAASRKLSQRASRILGAR